jgi:hypothetical protein
MHDRKMDSDLIGMSADTEEGLACFDRVIEGSRAFLSRYIKKKRLPIEDANDIEQQVVLKVLKKRLELRFDSSAKWYSYLKSAADSCVAEHWGTKGDLQPIDDSGMGQIPDEDLPTVQAILDAIEEQKLLLLADELWLGADLSFTDSQRDIRLLAAQLFFLHGLTWQEVLRLLNQGAGESALSRSQLDDWCSCWSIQRQAAYRSLHMDGDKLALLLLGVPWFDLGQLQALQRNAESVEPAGAPPATWTWTEVQVVLLRYRHNLDTGRIVSRCNGRVTSSEISSICDRCAALLPFVSIVKTMHTALRRSGSDPAVPFEEGLWRRLAFQYRYVDNLQVKDIQERVEAAAQVVERALNFGVLNMWLSGGRLLRQLGKHRQRRHG